MITPTPHTSPATSEAALVARITSRSFYRFVQEFWHTVVPEEPVWNWHIKYLCDELERACRRVFRKERKLADIIINISPGSTKSTITSIMLTPWAWTVFPQCRVIGGSHTQALSLELSRKGRDVVQSELYTACFGPDSQHAAHQADLYKQRHGRNPRAVGISLKDDQNTKSHWANTHGGGRVATTVGSSIIGQHAHIQIIDDPLDPKGARTKADIDAANLWMNETLPSRKVDKECSLMILIMQRLHQNDPTGNLLAKGRRVYHICLPAEVSEKVKPPRLKAKYQGGLMDPVRLSTQVLREAELELGQYGYSGQYRQHPVPPGGGMFKCKRFRFGEPPPLRDFVRLVRYWDKAGTHDGGAYTVGTLMGLWLPKPLAGAKEPRRSLREELLEGRLWVLDIVRGQWDSDEREDIILATAQMDGKRVRVGVEQEPGSAGKRDAQLTIKMLRGFRCYADPPSGDKTLRADPYSTQVNAGAVWLPIGPAEVIIEGEVIKGVAPWVPDYFGELEYFPDSTYKDQVDSSSGAFAGITEPPRRAGAM